MKPAEPAANARVSLADHVAAKGAEVRSRYGPRIGWNELQRILADRDFVRYPCEIAFDAGPLEQGELAFPSPKGENPEDGFTLHIHPFFALDPVRVPLIALYQIVAVNYGGFASPDDAEIFASEALGMGREPYYEMLCAMADEIGAPPQAEGCGCH
jgi:hypothetical protein